jgi:hypothetical protein
MVTRVRIALPTTVLALIMLGAPIPAGAHVAAKNPTRPQIKAAIAKAERSKSLWATVNVCTSTSKQDTIGIRGQMPTLGFPAWLSMSIQLNYYSTTKKKFVPVTKSGQKLVRVGRVSTGLQQAGALYTYKPASELVNASVTFIWKRSGKLLGQTTRTTAAGHPDADFGVPAHYSAQQCKIH